MEITSKNKRGLVMNYRKIFNMDQANFYILNGLAKNIIGSGVTNGCAWIKFKDSEHLQEIFSLWMNRKKNI